ERRKLAVNPATGAIQIVNLEAVEALPDTVPVAAPGRPQATKAHAGVVSPPPLFAHISDEQLQQLGTPTELITLVRSIASEADLDAAQAVLPIEAYEALFLLAAGDSVTQVLVARESRVDRKVDPADFVAALEIAESQSRFVVVTDDAAMSAILNAPLQQWRVFLHPTQRKLAQGDRTGPVRVLGGAGTGKTVLAMHRAKWLAEHRASDEQKVLFTTFTRNLAADIEENLKTLCPPSVLQRIKVKNLDGWGTGFLRRHKYEHRIVYNRKQGEAAEAWQRALAGQDTKLGLPPRFYEEELEKVVLAQGVSTRDEYRLAKR